MWVILELRQGAGEEEEEQSDGASEGQGDQGWNQEHWRNLNFIFIWKLISPLTPAMFTLCWFPALLLSNNQVTETADRLTTVDQSEVGICQLLLYLTNQSAANLLSWALDQWERAVCSDNQWERSKFLAVSKLLARQPWFILMPDSAVIILHRQTFQIKSYIHT